MTTGVSINDFQQILNDFGRTVSYSIVTKTVDSMNGSEITSYGAPANQTVIFFLNEEKYVWDKEGLVKVGDAYIIAPTTLGIKRYDQFSIGGETFYVDNVIRRNIVGTDMQDFANCFKVT